MKVLHVLDHSLPLHSGYVFRTQAILTEQRALGIETCHLTSGKQPDSVNPTEEVDGFEFYRTLQRPSVADRLPGMDQWRVVRSLRQRLESVVAEVRPDIVHAHSPCLNGLAALGVCRRRGLPLVYELRASWEDAAVSHGSTTEGSLRYRLSRALESFVLHRADHIVTICEGLRRDCMARGVSDTRITVVPNAVDRHLLDQDPVAPGDEYQALFEQLADRPVIGFFGSFYGYEGLDELLEAMVRVREVHPRVVLLLLGSGPEEGALKAQAERLGLRDCVRFIGRVPHEQVPAFYAQVSTFVFPRKQMRLTDIVTPLKPLEAMAAGALVIGSDVGGHRELIEHGQTGYLYPAGDIDALVESLTEVLEAPDQNQAVRKVGREFVFLERTWPAVAQRYPAIYDRLQK